MTAQWLPVRCCCEPSRIFGFVRVQYPGRSCVGLSLRQEEKPRLYTAGIREFDEPGMVNERSISSEGLPIAFWRNIVGFVEARRDD